MEMSVPNAGAGAHAPTVTIQNNVLPPKKKKEGEKEEKEEQIDDQP